MKYFKFAEKENMKIKYLILLFLPVLLLLSCSSALDNSITISNFAQETVSVNMLGKLITIKSGATVVVKGISKGTYNYVTTYNIPTGISTSQVEGNASGSLVITAGTRIRINFASRLQQSTSSGGGSSNQITYVLIVSVSSSDPVASTTTSP